MNVVTHVFVPLKSNLQKELTYMLHHKRDQGIQMAGGTAAVSSIFSDKTSYLGSVNKSRSLAFGVTKFGTNYLNECSHTHFFGLIIS
jgi:hypothetical protein